MRVFLGGTCNNSNWRDILIPMLDVEYFNPVVADWTPADQQREISEREQCDIVLYVITPLMLGVYSIAEVVDDSNKRPSKTMLCILNADDSFRKIWTSSQMKSLEAVKDLVRKNGATVTTTLDQTARVINMAAATTKPSSAKW